MRNTWLVSLLLLAATACNSGDEAARPAQPKRAARYFDLKGFLDAQATALNARNPAVEKQVRLRGGQLETVRVPHVDWSQELQIFYQADLNKAALQDAYTIASPRTAADGSQYQTYQRKPDVEAPVQQMTIVSAGAQVREISATLDQNNALFFSQKQLQLHVRNNQLIGYQVDGVQKLVLFDTLRYAATGRIQ